MMSVQRRFMLTHFRTNCVLNNNRSTITDVLTKKHLTMCRCCLSGSVDFLEQPAMAFVRLNEAVLLESVLEVPVPVRFIFVLLGPSQSNLDYHEIGRSFSTLMSDKVDVKAGRCEHL